MPGERGALVVDGGPPDVSASLHQRILAETGAANVHTLINTHWHPDQTGINAMVGRASGRIVAHEKTAMYLKHSVTSATFEGELAASPPDARVTESVREDGSLSFNGENVEYGYLPAAHTDGDLYVHWPARNLLAAGGVVAGDRWPLIDHRSGAWFGGRVRALQWLAELTDTRTTVVPSAGPLMDGAELVRQRDICLALFETLIDYMNRGFGPEDAVAENPLRDYESDYGSAADFLYGAYRSMLIAYVPD